ncbi:MAG TPA: succinate dehydrogenase, hydrophobic membrane anchor protein [Sedimenticola sp.]|nr:succinate dehydrogenase, hydrophobic membrane anchor protein [Sedimenticola sp.]
MSRQATGLRAWVLQRISAVYLGLYFIYLITRFLLAPPHAYQEWRQWFADPFLAVGMLLFFAALLIHAWVGVRDVVIDYVHPILLRVTLLTLTGLGLIGAGLWVMRTIYLAGASLT